MANRAIPISRLALPLTKYCLIRPIMMNFTFSLAFTNIRIQYSRLHLDVRIFSNILAAYIDYFYIAALELIGLSGGHVDARARVK